jgi:uncharacterized protein
MSSQRDAVPPISCWVVTEGLIGLQNQAKGLAEALGLSYEVKTVTKPGFPWRFLPTAFWPLSVARQQADFTRPWPDVVISCGRNSVKPALYIRQASGGKTFAVHVQHPHVNPALFDRVIVASHDSLKGDNVLTTQGALHRITRAKLDEAFAQFQPVFEPLKKPLYSVLVGGTTRSSSMTPEAARDLGMKLAKLSRETGGSLAVTMSRRTGRENEAVIRECLKGITAYIWDGAGANPYFGLLAHADAIVVTADSVSMTSEACSTGKPVYVYDSGLKSRRLRKFQDHLAACGLTRAFTGKLETWATPAIDDMKAAADFVRPALTKHLGVA